MRISVIAALVTILISLIAGILIASIVIVLATAALSLPLVIIFIVGAIVLLVLIFIFFILFSFSIHRLPLALFGLPGTTNVYKLILITVLFLFVAIFLLFFFGIPVVFLGDPISVLIILFAIIILTIFLLWLILCRLPGAISIPAVPFKLLWNLPETIFNLLGKLTQREQAEAGLSQVFTIGSTLDAMGAVSSADASTAEAFVFMGMGFDNHQPPIGTDSRTVLPLDSPDQYSMSWTTFNDVNLYGNKTFPFASLSPNRPDPADPSTTRPATYLEVWQDTLTNKDEANMQFWPTIARYGMVFNLIILKKIVSQSDHDDLKNKLGNNWSSEMENVWAAGKLFIIDMTIFETVKPQDINLGASAGTTRFTPATLTLLKQDSQKDLTPFAILVSDFGGATKTFFVVTDNAWLYALQAAKTSITVWGTWIGHVFNYHIVTAAMQMTMFQTLPPLHPVRQVLERQSDFLIGFDEFILLDWNISPATSINSSRQFLLLMDTHAATRTFFDDDPKERFKNLNLTEADFTSGALDASGAVIPFDKYPLVKYLLEIYDVTEKYVKAIVDVSYSSDDKIIHDLPLQAWIKTSGSRHGGNVKGLPSMNTRKELISVLTSLIFRITSHGSGRMDQSANPSLAFIPNFPPCLQSSTIPAPDSPMVFNTKLDPTNAATHAIGLNSFLPFTGTLGVQTQFLYTFVFSPPTNAFIPREGITEEPEHPFRGPKKDLYHNILVTYREDIIKFMDKWAKDSGIQNNPPAQIHQWELNIEL